MPSFPPTTEQQAIVNAVLTGETTVARAGAGTGKTSTLILCAEALGSKRIAYVAFNKDIATEATSKMPQNVEAKTCHGFAYRSVIVFPRSKFGVRLNGRKLPSIQVARNLGITAPLTLATTASEGEREAMFKTSTLGWIVTKTVERFCQSDSDGIDAYHVPLQDGLDKNAQAKLAAYIVPLANKVWSDVSNENGSAFKFDHCHYLKMFQLSGKPIMVKTNGQRAVAAEVVLFDEAQDAAPVIRAIVEQQKAQLVVVGDENQAIYGFTGAVNALDKFNAKHDLLLTKSFRFGPAIANVANAILAQLPTQMVLVGHDPVPSEAIV